MNILILGPERKVSGLTKYLEERGDTTLRTEAPVSVEYLTENRFDYLISHGYAPIIRPSVISAFRRRIINIHPAYLPTGRGIYPNFWCFFEGRTVGVSIHFIDEGIDTGEIIARRIIHLDDQETLRTSHAKLDRAVEEMFFETWPSIVDGSFEAIDQNSLQTGSYRNRAESERLIELLDAGWDTPSKQVEQMGAELLLSELFWECYETEIADC